MGASTPQILMLSDMVIDCVGMEATAGHGVLGVLGRMREKLTTTQRPYVLAEAITSERPSGVVSMPGVYAGPVPVNMVSIDYQIVVFPLVL